MPVPAIQVFMPVRDGAAFLPATLDSLAAQTCRDFRLVACDDGSTDSTWSILSKESRFPVDCFRNAREPGLVSASNQLVERCLAGGSPYLARIDADDICHPERFALQKAFLEQHPDIGIVGSALRFIDAHGKPDESLDYPLADEDIRFALLFEDALAHPVLMFRTDTFATRADRYDPAFEYAEDYELWCRLAGRVRFANLPQELLRYRRHPRSVSLAKARTQAAKALEARRAYLRRQGWPAHETEALSRVLRLSEEATTRSGRLADLVVARRVWRRDFPLAARRAPGSRRIAHLTGALFAQLNWPQRVAWALREPRIVVFYLRAKFPSLAKPAA